MLARITTARGSGLNTHPTGEGGEEQSHISRLSIKCDALGRALFRPTLCQTSHALVVAQYRPEC